jgi:Fe2+ or Zn2+ uptake regulation protein
VTATDPGVDAILAEVIELLRERGGRASAGLRPVLEALVAANGHRSAEELAGDVHTRHPEIHETTVYRNLDRFEQLGVAYHTHLGHGPALWHLTASIHQHLTCEACGAVVAVDPAVFTALAATLQREAGFVADFRHFAISGRCADCHTEPQRTDFTASRRVSDEACPF